MDETHDEGLVRKVLSISWSDTKHDIGECQVYSGSSEWAGVEQKVSEGEQSLVACKVALFTNDLKVFNVTLLGSLVTCNVGKVPLVQAISPHFLMNVVAS